jgi:hypothetical protein
MKNFLKTCLIIALFASACKQDDSDPPKIVSFDIVQDSIAREDGAKLQFTYSLLDDVGLSKLRVTVLSDFDAAARLNSDIWEYEKDFVLSGLELSETKSIVLPYPNLELGRYELTITIADSHDNEVSSRKNFIIY